MKNRLTDYKLGQIHGKLKAKDSKSEAQIQRTLFLSQKINLHFARGKALAIRLFGYEVPLERDTSRGRCVDLMGYDERHNLYLVELKDETSSEGMEKIERQITDYEEKVRGIIGDIQRDFRSEFYLPIRFDKIYKIILAPRRFYEERQRIKEIKNSSGKDIIYADFGGRDIYGREPGKPISIHLKKKCNLPSTAAQKK